MSLKLNPALPHIAVTGRASSSHSGTWYRICLSDGARSKTCIVSLDNLDRDSGPLVNAARKLDYSIVGRAQERLMAEVGAAIDDMRDSSLPQFRIATNVGWTKELDCFVTPRRKYGAAADEIEVADLSGVAPVADYAQAGDLEKWKTTFSELLRLNRLFVAGACIALMPPLLALVGYRGCMIEFVGPTSKGKSTLMEFMGSLRGGSATLTFQESFRTTSNGLESYAFSANDSLLLIDDIRSAPGNARARAELAEEALYLFAGGKEKNRQTNGRSPRSFRTIAVTSDNLSLIKLLAEGGTKYDPSMSVRLIQISVDLPNGVIDQVPEGTMIGEYVEHVEQQALNCYGAPTNKFLKRLLEARDHDEDELLSRIKRRIVRARNRLLDEDANGMERRISKYFGLAYAAGCFAIEHGILPITRVWLRESIAFTYEQHLAAASGETADDPLARLRQILKHQEERMLDLRSGRHLSDTMFEAAAGYKTGSNDAYELSFTKEQFSKLLPSGISTKRMCDALKRRGLLIHDEGASAKNQTKRRLRKSEKRARVYCISSRILDLKN